jgi:hypothetical protein
MIVPSLFLDQQQAARLLIYIQIYRRYTLTQVSPSAERNTAQRVLQALQGRLIQEREQQPQQPLALALTTEERTTLTTMVTNLCRLKAQESPSPRRDATIVDLTELKSVLEKLARPAQPARSTQHLFQLQEQQS